MDTIRLIARVSRGGCIFGGIAGGYDGVRDNRFGKSENPALFFHAVILPPNRHRRRGIPGLPALRCFQTSALNFAQS